MRAFMSDVDGGPVFLRAPLVSDVTGRTWTVPSMSADDVFAAQWALNEARAILAETERVPHEHESCLCVGHAQLYPIPHVQGVNWQEHPYTALADALRAFVEEN